ncbi:MAG: hypothetical protein ACO29O_08990 [Chitinophagaceae bacterium]
MNRVLPSEKTKEDKPLNPWQKAFNNLPTHYNFHFNGELKLNEILENAVSGFKDDYSRFLPFYNFRNTLPFPFYNTSLLPKKLAGHG